MNGDNKPRFARSSLVAIAVVVALVLVVFAALWLAPTGPQAALAQANSEPRAPQLTVRGSANVSARPPVLLLSVGVTIQEATIKGAEAKVSRAVGAVLQELNAAGIAEQDYRTVQYSVETVLDYGDERAQPRLLGFRVTQLLEVTLRDQTRAADLLDALVRAGANTISAVSSDLADPNSLGRAYDQALKNAEVSANQLSALAGLKLGKIISVTDSTVGLSGPVYSGVAGAGGTRDSQQPVQVELTVTYEAIPNR